VKAGTYGAVSAAAGALAALFYSHPGLRYLLYLLMLVIAVPTLLLAVWHLLLQTCPGLTRGRTVLLKADRWRQADASEVSAVADNLLTSLSPTGEDTVPTSNDELHASMTIVIRVPCPPLPILMPTSSVVADRFLHLLGGVHIRDIFSFYTEAPRHANWRSLGAGTRSRQDAVLEIVAPRAASLARARIRLPDPRPFSSAKHKLYADLIVSFALSESVDKASPRADLTSWRTRFYQIFALADTFVTFLATESTLGLNRRQRNGNSAKPIETLSAEVSFRLEAVHGIADLVIHSESTTSDDGRPSKEFSAHAIADTSGERPSAIAQSWLIDMCETVLQLRDYEYSLARMPKLPGLSTFNRSGGYPTINRRALVVRVLGASLVSVSAGVIIDRTIFGGRIIKTYVYPPRPSPSPSPHPVPTATPHPCPKLCLRVERTLG
jgi:hypothetical protein